MRSLVFSSGAWLGALGYALVAFVWQGAAIGVLATLALIACRRSAPSVRYAIGCAALAVMAMAPVLTAALAVGDGTSVQLANVAAAVESAVVPAGNEIAGLASAVAVRPVRLASYFPIVTIVWATIAGPAIVAMLR